MTAPRNVELVNTATIFLSTVMSLISPVVMTFVFSQFRTVRYRPAFSHVFLPLSMIYMKSSFVSAITVVSSTYLKFVSTLPPMPIPPSHLSKSHYFLCVNVE